MAKIRVKAAAERVGCSVSLLNQLRCRGGGPQYFKLGAAVIYDTDDVDAWLAERARTSTWAAANDNSKQAGRAAA